MKKFLPLMIMVFSLPVFAHYHYVNVDDGGHLLTIQSPSIIASITTDAGEDAWDIRCTCTDPKTMRIDGRVMWRVYYNGNHDYFYGSYESVLDTAFIKPKGLKVYSIEVRANMVAPYNDGAIVQFNSLTN